MFVEEASINRVSLLQGDIIADIQLLGALNYQEIQYLMPTMQGADSRGWTSLAKREVGSAMIVSHSCEIAQENSVKVTSIILAPLRDASKATKPEKLQELIDSNFIGALDKQASYLKYFYVPENEKMGLKGAAVADFSKLFSIRKGSYEYVLERKVLEMQDAAREQMALKLALYFYRSAAQASAA